MRTAVVVPTYGRVDELRRCLASVAALDPAPDLAVVVDGNEAPAELGALPPWAGVVREPNRGPSRARNAGWRAAAEAGADLVLFLDDDAVAPVGWVAAHRRAHERHPRAVVGGRARNLHEGSVVADYADRFVFAPLRDDAGPVRMVASMNLSCPVAALEDVGGFDEALLTNEDVDLCHRLAAAGWEVRHDPADDLAVGHHHPRTWRALVRQQRAYGRGFVAARTRWPDLPGADLLAMPSWRAAAGTVPHLARSARAAARAGGVRMVAPSLVRETAYRLAILANRPSVSTPPRP